MSRLKVMHVIARMNVGGPAVEISELMRGLESDGIDQTLVTGWCGEDEPDFLLTQATDIPAIRIDGFGRLLHGGDDLRALKSLTREIRRHRPDVVHTHTAKAGVLGRLAARYGGIRPRIVHTHHGHLLHGYFSPPVTRLVVTTERSLARITHRIITVGMQVERDLLNAGIGKPEQYQVIRSGVRLGHLPSKEQARRTLGLADDVPVVTLMGRLTRIKRPDRFAEVVELVRERIPKAMFLVAGAGDEESNLRQTVKERNLPVTMLGWRNDIEYILAASDVMLLTSDNEGTPLSLVQAALAGVPSVATDVGSVREVIAHGETGLLCEPKSVDLSESVISLIRDSNLRHQLGVRAAVKASRDFGLTAFLENHARCYRSL